jgi:NTP pyrophosphatase (non-canonical NTP hydrolase)
MLNESGPFNGARLMKINEWSSTLHKVSKDAGWWNDLNYNNTPVFIGTKFALIHSEVSEAFEAYRKDTKDDHLPDRSGVEVELADVLIRIFDLAGFLKLDLENAIIEKTAYNQQRKDHKLEARNAPGGKKF